MNALVLSLRGSCSCGTSCLLLPFPWPSQDIVSLDGKTFLLGSWFGTFFWSLTACEKLLSSLSRFIFSFFCFFLWKERKNKATTLVTLFPEEVEEEEEAFLSFKCRLWRRGQLLVILISSFLHGLRILWFKVTNDSAPLISWLFSSVCSKSREKLRRKKRQSMYGLMYVSLGLYWLLFCNHVRCILQVGFTFCCVKESFSLWYTMFWSCQLTKSSLLGVRFCGHFLKKPSLKSQST